MNVALVSMPWSLFNRPSIQLGALKAYLEQEGDIVVDTLHPYLRAAKSLGVEDYHYLSKNSWAGEALFSAILYPDRALKAEKVFRKSCKGDPTRVAKFSEYQKSINKNLNEWVDSYDFSKYSLIGMSVCFSQLFSSLAASKIIKEKYPDTPIVFGGSSCAGDAGLSLLKNFSYIDYVIGGEGETPLLSLCQYLQGKTKNYVEQIQSYKKSGNNPYNIINDINTLPVPDYRPYFNELQHEFPDQPFIPTLPLEFSRGCWWNKCTFCNLNLQWHGYRKKSVKKLLSELSFLTDRHKCLDFTFCDNALPTKESNQFFKETSTTAKDYHFFAEIRIPKDPEELITYRRGGLTTIQVGIEALSDSLLKKMTKGTKAIENIAIIKHCAEHNIQLEGNLIVEFPGSTKEEVDETLTHLDYVLPFHPLTAATFFLGTGSIIDNEPNRFHIQSSYVHPYTRELFPADISDNLTLLIKDFRGNKTEQRKLWRPVRQKLEEWQKFHNTRKNSIRHPLSYRDGGTFIIIRQELPGGRVLRHRLQGKSRELYLFCCTIRQQNEIAQHFPDLPEKSVLNFFDDLSKKGLLFRENHACLALAIHDTHQANSTNINE